MGKLGTQCCAFGCSKRRKNVKGDLLRSDSEGSTDDESGLKYGYLVHFTSKRRHVMLNFVSLFASYCNPKFFVNALL